MSVAREKKPNNGLFARLNRTLNLKMSYKVSLYFAAIFFVVALLTVAVTFVVMNSSIRAEGRAQARAICDKVIESVQGGQDPAVVASILDGEDVQLCIVANGTTAGSLTVDASKFTTAFSVSAKKVYGMIVAQECTVYVQYDLSQAYHALLTPKMILVICLLVSLVTVVFVGSMAAHGVTKPIREMTATTRTITTDALNTRLNTDTTQDELKELAQEINKMLDELQDTLQAQERFVGDASHELRTPISVIKGYASMLERWGKTDPAVLEESIEAISKETQNMQLLIDNLLFLSRTEREVVAPSFETFLLNDLVDEVIQDYVLVDKNHTYVRAKMDVVEVEGNVEMVRQLVRTVVDNAVKYTPEGRNIFVGCFVEEQSGVITVQDQGVGIATEELPRIFDRFYRADKARKRAGGYGLGMSIAKKIADVHHGEIRVTSKLGEGTTVQICLPITQQGEEK